MDGETGNNGLKQITLAAYAKLNLTLDILRKRPDGYHDLRMVMQSISLHDDVSVRETEDGSIRCRSSLPYLSQGSGNLAVKAAECFFQQTGLPRRGLEITLDKRIPIGAGMAGGSSDGAAVLQVLRRWYAPRMPQEELERIGLLVGSDVPFCLRGGTALAEGRGERLTELPPLPPCHLVLCKPTFSISTAELFGSLAGKKLRLHPDTAGVLEALERQDLKALCRRFYNVFEEVLPNRYREVQDIKRRLLDCGAQATLMTGSGSTVYGVFEDADEAQRCYERLRADYPLSYRELPIQSIR